MYCGLEYRTVGIWLLEGADIFIFTKASS